AFQGAGGRGGSGGKGGDGGDGAGGAGGPSIGILMSAGSSVSGSNAFTIGTAGTGGFRVSAGENTRGPDGISAQTHTLSN
ncbi:MAG: hypothetical protein HOP14_15390, partial [Acidobacteria bacterium]|nr:hypothetical protein [Acidobacteriota bacterium]